jgi:hypothetical protein
VSNTIVPASPGFNALFLSQEALKIPRQFTYHPVVAWLLEPCEREDGEPHAIAWPICVSVDGSGYDFILSPDGKLEHTTGYTCDKIEEEFGYALDQEAMARRNRASIAQA